MSDRHLVSLFPVIQYFAKAYNDKSSRMRWPCKTQQILTRSGGFIFNNLLTRDIVICFLLPRHYRLECSNIHLYNKSLATCISFCNNPPVNNVLKTFFSGELKKNHDNYSFNCAELGGDLKKAMALHSSTPAWKIPWMEEPGGLQSMESLRVGHDWATSLSLFTFMH